MIHGKVFKISSTYNNYTTCVAYSPPPSCPFSTDDYNTTTMHDSFNILPWVVTKLVRIYFAVALTKQKLPVLLPCLHCL